MKRKLSLLLAVVMILGSFSFAYAAEDFDAAEFLEEVGVLKGDTSGDLMEDEALLRRDSVVLLSRLMGAEDVAEEFPVTEELPSFEDITDNYYAPYLAWAESNGYIVGKAEGKFGFNDNLTTKEYSVVLLRALEYVDEAADWDAVFETAEELGLLEDVETEADEEFTRADMAQMTVNALGVKIKDSELTLAEKLEIEMPEPEVLEVEEVFADNLKEIQVKFNKDVDRDNVEDRDIYTTNAGTIKDARLMEDNAVVLTLDGEMKNNKEYKLNIRGLEEGDAAVNSEFKFTAKDNAIPEVVDVVGLGTKAIKVVMSEPVKNVKSSSFKIDGKTYYGSTSVAGRDIILKPYGSDFGVGEHTLVVKSLEDYAGFKSVETEKKFEIVEDTEAPTVVEIKGTMERIVVTFSEAVDDATVVRDNLYWGGVKSNKADKVVRLSGDRFAFEFSDSKTLPTYETVITVKGVKDYSGNEIKTVEIPFKATIDQTRPEVIDVDVDTKEIEVKFNKGLNRKDATDKKNYTITDEDDKKVSIKDLELSDDERTVTIELYKDLKENKDYTLEITGIRDNTKLANTILPYKETISAGNYSRPKVVAITGNPDKETIHILFNKKMDVETIANPSNYILAGKDEARYALDDIDGDVDVIQDGKAVILELPEKINKEKVSGMEFGENGDIVGVILSGLIQDTAENRVQKYGTIIEFAEEKVSVKTAEVVDERTIELEFTHPIEDARRSDFDAKGFNIDEVKVDGTVDVVIKTTKDLDAGLLDDYENKIELSIVDDNKIETVLDLEVEEQKNIELVDKIKPTLEEAEGIVNEGETKLTLILKFDEALDKDYEELAKRDLNIVSTEDGKLDMSKGDVESKISGKTITITTEQKVSKDAAYEIEIINPGAIRDIAGNLANKTDGAIVAEKVTVEQDADEKAAVAVEVVNEATTETIAKVITDNAEVLGLELTAYNALEDKAPVHEALVGKDFADAKEVKTAFNDAVADQKAIEEEAENLIEAKVTLENTIVDAKDKVYNAEIGDSVGNYSQEAVDELRNAITVAEGILNNTEASLEEVNTGIENLNTAITTFEGKVVKPVVTTVEVTVEPESVTKPEGENTVTSQATVVVKDQDDNVMEDQEVTYSIEPVVDGVTIDESGLVTITSEIDNSTEVTITVKATVSEVEGTANITVPVTEP